MDAKEFIQLVRDAGYGVRSYSGRCMYGENCVGVTTKDPYGLVAGVMRSAGMIGIDDTVDTVASIEQMIENKDDELQDLEHLFSRTKTDSMGLSTIVYWPSLTWPEGEEDDEGDSEQ